MAGLGPRARRVSPGAATWITVASAWVTVAISSAIAAASEVGRALRDCPPNAADCYPYGDTRIELEYSPLYETVTLPANAATHDVEALRAGIEEAGLGTTEQFPSLSEQGTIVVRFADTEQALRDPAALRRRLEHIVAEFNRQRDGGRWVAAVTGRHPAGNPVYSKGDAHFVLVNEVIVQFIADAPRADRLVFFRQYGAEILTDRDRRNWYVVRFTGRDARDALRTANAMHSEQIVEFAQPNFVELMAKGPREGSASAPSPKCPDMREGALDPLFADQWYLENRRIDGRPFADVNAMRAWQVTTGRRSVVVAVIDDGVAADHDDLEGKLVSGYDAYDQDGDPSPHPWDGHGTAVAGIVAAVAGNRHGIKGMAPNVTVAAVRVYAYPSDIAYDADMSHAVIKDGIESAADLADVLNNSWTKSQGIASNNAIESAIDYALRKGRVVVFAAGNQGSAVRYPALLSRSANAVNQPRPVIAVGATDKYDQWVDWSNFGAHRIDVVAPGLDLVTTDAAGVDGFCAGDYVTFSGTSASAALVSGTAALMLSSNPTLSPSAVRERVRASAVDLGLSTGYDQRTGHGRIDACRALSGADCERPPREASASSSVRGVGTE